ncbi:MAG TPA: hypothetical protein GXX14_03670 [Clostridiaceae bacterium]|nr:hypothetical protein [Clostridiaceae bacterium]
MASKGVIAGIFSATCSHGKNTATAGFVIFLARTLELKADFSINKEGIIQGIGNSLNPKGSTTRAETAMAVYKICKNVNNMLQ